MDIFNSLDVIGQFFVVAMLIEFVAEFLYFRRIGTSIKSVIVTTGVLGTFVGIVYGLYNFDTSNIEQSIPQLLDGLKTAFVTSVLGMIGAILITITDKIQEHRNRKLEQNSEKDILIDIVTELKNMNNKIEKLENIEKSNLEISDRLSALERLNNEISKLGNLEQLSQLSKLENIEKSNSEIANRLSALETLTNEISKLDKLEKIEEHSLDISTKVGKLVMLESSTTQALQILQDIDQKSSNISEQLGKLETIDSSIQELKNNQNEQNQILIEAFGKNFEEMNQLLEKTFQKISEGASKEIIKALEDVIRDFNNNLVDSFGENFKQLNHAVIELVQWQENYKTTIQEMETNLKIAIEAIKSSETSLSTIADKQKEIDDVYTKLSSIIETYKYQTDEVNRHLQTYAELSDKAKEVFPNIEKQIKDISDNFQMTTGAIVAELSEMLKNIEEKQTASIENIRNSVEENSKSMVEAIAQSTNTITNKFTDMVQNVEEKQTETIRKLETLISDVNLAIEQNGEKITTALNQVNTEFETNKDKIISTLENQTNVISETLRKEVEAIEKISQELPNQLQDFGDTVTTLTSHFMDNYKTFLENAKKLMDSSN